MKPVILIVNDDERLCETRKMLLESCGAEVYTACGRADDIAHKLQYSLDLVLIDSTNVGLKRGEQLCRMVKAYDNSRCVAMLARPETGVAADAIADHLILRTGPRQMLVEINELLKDRLDINLWKSSSRHGDQGSLV